jgi:hypothetical protein
MPIIFLTANKQPEIRAMYEAELKKAGIPLRMKPIERARTM